MESLTEIKEQRGKRKTWHGMEYVDRRSGVPDATVDRWAISKIRARQGEAGLDRDDMAVRVWERRQARHPCLLANNPDSQGEESEGYHMAWRDIVMME